MDLKEYRYIYLIPRMVDTHEHIHDVFPRTKEYKHSKGQYFTTDSCLKGKVFEFIQNNPTEILEPSVGRGDLVEFVQSKKDVRFISYEIDESIVFLPSVKDTVIIGDFMQVEHTKYYHTIIGNPPFVKTRTGNLYVGFIQSCFNILEDKGELIFIVPTDFFKLTHASALLTEMIDKGQFTHIYHPNNEGLFKDASIDVMVFRYCKDPSLDNKTIYNGSQMYLIETNGLITFSMNGINPGVLLSDVFVISVGLVCGKESVYRNSTLGNMKVLTNKNTYTDYIYPESFPTGDKPIDEHLLKHKDCLINRRIKKYDESNWYEWGAPRNIQKMKDHQGEDCIYVLPMTRETTIAFIGKVDYFGGLIMMRPTKDCDLQKVIDHLNSEVFKSNYMYSGRFKIGQRQLSNSRVVL